MQPEPSGSSVRPSNGGSAVLQGELSQRLKRKACGDDSCKKFRKVSADFVVSPQTAYHSVDVSDVSTVGTPVNGVTADPTPIAFKRGSVKNEKIYLDLKDGQLTQDLEKYITRFGGIVEKFLSKDITCVVTSRINPIDMKAEDAILKKEAFSPHTAEKPKPDIYSSLGVMSRGKTLLLRSNSTKAASSSVCGPVQFARTWKIPVVEVSVLRNMLRKENNHRKQVSSQSSKPNVKKLDKPFVKVEDAMQMYSTNFRLFNSFPMSYLSSADSLPCNGASQSNESSVKKKAKQKRIKKSGYCECCDVSFTDQKEHLNSRMHKAFVMRNENFASLDALVSKLPSLEKFAFAMELDTKNLASSGSITGADAGLVHGLSDSQAQDHNLNPFVRDRSVHGTKRLYPGSSANSKFDVKNLCDAQNSKSSGSVLPATVFAPSSSCPIRKPRTKKSLNTSSKSCTRNSDSFHVYEKCDDDLNLIRSNDRPAGKSVNKVRIPNKGSHSDLCVDLNCPVDLSLPKSSTGVSSYQSSVSSLSTVSELNFTNAAVCSRKISEVSKSLKIGKSLKINKDTTQMKPAISNCSDKISDIGDHKIARNQLIPERMDITLDLKLLATPIAVANVELRSPFLGCANAISKDMSKDDDLDFSSDEVSDSADEKVDWRINLRNSCNKVLNILEDSNSSKDLANIMPDDCVNNSTIKLELTDVQVAEDCHEASPNKKEFHFSNVKNLNMPGTGIQPGLDETEKAIVRKVSVKETSTSSSTKHHGVGIVRPWEMVSNKSEANPLRMDKKSHCNMGTQVLGTSDSSACVLQTDSEQCSNSNTVYGQIKSSENFVAAVRKTEEVLLSEATHSDDDRDPPTTNSTKGSNPKVTHLNEHRDPETTYSTDGTDPEKTPSLVKDTTVNSDVCTVESAVLGAAVSCQAPQRILHSPAPVNVCVAEQGAKAVTAEIVSTAVAEIPSRFQDSPHSSSQSSIIVDVEACDERSDDSDDKYQTPIPDYEVISPVKPQMPSSLDVGDRGMAFGSNYQVLDQQSTDQSPSWPMTPVLVNRQVVYQPASVVGIPMSPTLSKQLTGMDLTNGNAACEFLPGVNCELQIQKQDSACSSLDSGFCASVNTITVDSYPGSPVERSVDEAETSIHEMKHIHSHTENPVSSPVPVPAEHPDSLSAAKQSEHEDSCRSAMPVSSVIASQCETSDSVQLHIQSNNPTLTALPLTPKTPSSIPVPLQTEGSDQLNPHIQGEGAGSLATPVQTQSFSSVSIQAADDEISPALCQTENNNLLLVSGQNINPHCSQPVVIQRENTDHLPVRIRAANVVPCANQEEKSDSFVAVGIPENHSSSPGADKLQIDEIECKDILVQPALPKTKVKKEKIDVVKDFAFTTVQIEEFTKVVTVPDVQTYPDLMSGINELPERAKTHMPDLLMEAKNDTALDSPGSSICPLVSADVHQSVPESLPPRSNFLGSEPMDVGFGELSEDCFTARSNPITFYGIDKNEGIPWMDNAWGPANHAVETPAAVDTWPEELATIVQSSCPNELSPSGYISLDSLMMSAPIGTPNCVGFSDDESCVPATAKKEISSGVSYGPRTDVRSANSVNSVAEPSVLDDVVLTALSKILEDASKEWQAERQKSNATVDETEVCSTSLACVPDKELKQETRHKISSSHTASVEISTSSMLQTPKPIVQMELQSVAIDDAKHGDFSEVLCSVPQSHLLENGSSCVDGDQQDDRPVAQALEHCINEAKKESDETSEAEPFSTASTPTGELDDLDKLMQMLKALNEETKFRDDAELTSSCNVAANNSCQTLTKVNNSELVLDLPNNFCDNVGGISFTKAHKTSRQVAAMTKSVHLFSDGRSRSISSNHFSKDLNERACQFEEKNLKDGCKKDGCKWKMTYISGLKFLFQRLLHSPDQSHCFGKYSIKSLGSERLALRISKNKSKSNFKS